MPPKHSGGRRPPSAQPALGGPARDNTPIQDTQEVDDETHAHLLAARSDQTDRDLPSGHLVALKIAVIRAETE